MSCLEYIPRGALYMASKFQPIRSKIIIPLFKGILPKKASNPLDIVAGITQAALAIPEIMGYAKIAGMPVVGVYTSRI
jgi:sulfate permease, SulP family